jgi:hypothetical protein
MNEFRQTMNELRHNYKPAPDRVRVFMHPDDWPDFEAASIARGLPVFTSKGGKHYIGGERLTRMEETHPLGPDGQELTIMVEIEYFTGIPVELMGNLPRWQVMTMALPQGWPSFRMLP